MVCVKLKCSRLLCLMMLICWFFCSNKRNNGRRKARIGFRMSKSTKKKTRSPNHIIESFVKRGRSISLSIPMLLSISTNTQCKKCGFSVVCGSGWGRGDDHRELKRAEPTTNSLHCYYFRRLQFSFLEMKSKNQVQILLFQLKGTCTSEWICWEGLDWLTRFYWVGWMIII